MNTTPAASQQPTIPLAGAWQPLPNAGATPHTTDTDTKRWVARAFLALIMIACVSVGTWSIYTLITHYFHAPQGVGYLGAGVFDVAALYFAYLGQQYATTTDSGLAPRLAMLATISLSVYVNWTHAQLEGWGSIGGIVLAAPSVVAEVAFEMWHKFEHRETLRRLGRVAQTLPVIGKWAWLRHPVRSQRAIDSHIKASLTEHEAIAARRETVAGERARRTVSLPLPMVSGDHDLVSQVHLERVSAPAIETSRTETETRETPVSPRTETSKTETETTTRDRSPETHNSSETSETETSLPVSTTRSPRETTKVTAIGDRETETNKLLDLMRSRGGEMKVSLNEAIETTRRPKATAAKRLKTARDQYLAETA